MFKHNSDKVEFSNYYVIPPGTLLSVEDSQGLPTQRTKGLGLLLPIYPCREQWEECWGLRQEGYPRCRPNCSSSQSQPWGKNTKFQQREAKLEQKVRKQQVQGNRNRPLAASTTPPKFVAQKRAPGSLCALKRYLNEQHHQ